MKRPLLPIALLGVSLPPRAALPQVECRRLSGAGTPEFQPQ